MIQLTSIRFARPAHARPSEDGYTLLVVIFLMAILTLWMAVAVPKMTRSIQRDRDLETMHRGKQYIRAIQLYYRKFHAFPPSIDALVKTNEIRFLRKRYLDPLTGKDDWKPIMYGQNKAPIAMGFFGQPLMASTLAGIGPGGANGLQGSAGQFGNSGQAGSLGSIFNSQQSTTTATQSTTVGQVGTDTSNGATDSSNGGTGTAATGTTGTDANGNPVAGTTGTAGAPSGQAFGGAGICGFSPASPKQSILIYKKKDHYNEWEFTYDPIMEQMNALGGIGGASGLGTNANGLGTGTGDQSGGSGSTPNPRQGSPNGNLPGVGTPNN